VGVARSLCRRLLPDIVIVNCQVMALSTTLTQCTPETTKFGKITQNKNHLACLSNCRYCADGAQKSATASPQQCTQSAPDFIQIG